MKKKLFNIHKLIGLIALLFFFLSAFFGILSIYKPYISFWEDSQRHFTPISIEEINLDRCVKQVAKRKYFDEDGKPVENTLIKFFLPQKEFRSENLIKVQNRPNFFLDPVTCKRVRPKAFQISQFFEKIHYGRIWESITLRIIFGFISVAVVFLCLSGLFLIFKNSYRNSKPKNIKSFYAKYHRLILLYTLPLVFMFGLTGALFNLGVYSSPLITNYLTNGKSSNILKQEKNILVDKDLEVLKNSQKTKNMKLNLLYKKAKEEFEHISFYQMQVYNYQDINAKVKFIGYEPKKFFISSVFNESSVVLDANKGTVISKKIAEDGSFTEKTLDSIFYLHYLKTFSDLPRNIFALICMIILFGLVFALNLWLERTKDKNFTYRVLKPLSFTIILGSLLGTTYLLATVWLIPKEHLEVNLFEKVLSLQEILFYLCFIFTFVLIKILNDLHKTTRYIFLLSSIFLLVAVISQSIMGKYHLFIQLENGLPELFFTNIGFIFLSLVFFTLFFKLNEKYFNFDNKTKEIQC